MKDILDINGNMSEYGNMSEFSHPVLIDTAGQSNSFPISLPTKKWGRENAMNAQPDSL